MAPRALNGGLLLFYLIIDPLLLQISAVRLTELSTMAVQRGLLFSLTFLSLDRGVFSFSVLAVMIFWCGDS